MRRLSRTDKAVIAADFGSIDADGYAEMVQIVEERVAQVRWEAAQEDEDRRGGWRASR